MKKSRSNSKSPRTKTPAINIAALRDPRDDRDYLADSVFAARLRAVCEPQGIDVVDDELSAGDRAAFEREVERIARARSSPEGWWRAQDRLRWRRDCLQWCAKHRAGHRREGAADDTYDLPLSRGGVPAMLMASDLTNDAGAKELLSRWANLRYKPTLEQLQQAKAVCHAIDRIFAHGGADTWAYVAKMHEAVFTTDIARVSAIEAIEEGIHLFRCVREVDEWGRGDDEDGRRDGEVVRKEHAERTLRALIEIDERFSKVNVKIMTAELREAAKYSAKELTSGGRGKRGAVALVAELALSCGAFDEKQKGKAYEPAVRQAKRNFTRARQRVEELTKVTPR